MGLDPVGQLDQRSRLRTFSTGSFGHGKFEFIAFWANWFAKDNSHDPPLATEVGRRAEMTHHLCPNHFAIRAALGSLSSVAPILRTDGGQSIRFIVLRQFPGFITGSNYTVSYRLSSHPGREDWTLFLTHFVS